MTHPTDDDLRRAGVDLRIAALDEQLRTQVADAVDRDAKRIQSQAVGDEPPPDAPVYQMPDGGTMWGTWEADDEGISFVVDNSEGRYSIRYDVDARSIYSQAVTTTFELMEWLAAEGAKRPEPIKSFKLTQGQLDELKASAPTRVQAATYPTLLGIPLEIVEDVRDSTPFQRWWEDAKAALAAHHERAE